MGLLIENLVKITEIFARRLKGVTREKLARLHEQIAEGIRSGKFVAEEAIEQFEDDATKLQEAFDRLPD